MQSIDKNMESAFKQGFREAVKQSPDVLADMDVKVNPFPFDVKQFVEKGLAEFTDGYDNLISLEYERHGKVIKVYSSCVDFDSEYSYESVNDGMGFAEELGRNTYLGICKLMDDIEQQGGFDYEEEDEEKVEKPETKKVEAIVTSSEPNDGCPDIDEKYFTDGLKSVDQEKLKWKYDFRKLSSFIDVPKLLESKRIKFVTKSGDKIEIKLKLEYIDEGVEYSVSVYRNLKYAYDTGYLSESKCKNKAHFCHTLSKLFGTSVGLTLLDA